MLQTADRKKKIAKSYSMNTIQFVVSIAFAITIVCSSSISSDPVLNRGNLAAAYGKGSVLLCQHLEDPETDIVKKIVLDLRTVWECSLSLEVCRRDDLTFALTRIRKSEASVYTEWPECEFMVWKSVRGDFDKTREDLPFSSSERHDLGLAYGKGSASLCNNNMYDSRLLGALRMISKCSSSSCPSKDLKTALRRISKYRNYAKNSKFIACERNMWILTRSSDFESNLAFLLAVHIQRRLRRDPSVCVKIANRKNL